MYQLVPLGWAAKKTQIAYLDKQDGWKVYFNPYPHEFKIEELPMFSSHVHPFFVVANTVYKLHKQASALPTNMLATDEILLLWDVMQLWQNYIIVPKDWKNSPYNKRKKKWPRQ